MSKEKSTSIEKLRIKKKRFSLDEHFATIFLLCNMKLYHEAIV